MPSDREVRDRRRAAIREILLHDEPVHHQHALVNRLRERGFAATQSNVSRDLRDIGAVRHEGQYMIPSWTQSEDAAFRKVVPFIRKVNPGGPNLLLIVTDPGAGPAVAQAIQEDQWPDLVGTVDGHNSVLLVLDNFLFQKLVYQRIRHYLGMEFVKLDNEDEDEDGEEPEDGEEGEGEE